MADYERKLAEYRARKSREQLVHSTKDRISKLFTFSRKMKNEDPISSDRIQDEDAPKNYERELLIKEDDHNVDFTGDLDDDANLNCCTYADMVYYLLCFILWGTVYMIFIKLQFGTVYFIVSILVGMYLNTRTKKKLPGEISAYSVFNENCTSIDGTLKGEQFEREMGYKPF